MIDSQSDTNGLMNFNNNNRCEDKQNELSKKVIRPWEEISFNKDRHGLGYNIENTFYVLDFSKPVQFVSVDFLENSQNHVKCNHCKRNGHMESKYFGLHP